MKILPVDFQENIGTFDSICGNTMLFDDILIIPMFNIQFDYMSDVGKFLRSGYFCFKNISISKKRIDIKKDQFYKNDFSFFEYLIVNTKFDPSNQNEYFIETYNLFTKQLFGEWIINAENFFLIVADTYEISENVFLINDLNKNDISFLKNDDIQKIKSLIQIIINVES